MAIKPTEHIYCPQAVQTELRKLLALKRKNLGANITQASLLEMLITQELEKMKRG